MESIKKKHKKNLRTYPSRFQKDSNETIIIFALSNSCFSPTPNYQQTKNKKQINLVFPNAKFPDRKSNRYPH